MPQAQLEQVKAAVTQREAEVSRAQIDFDRTLIRSPIDGVVVDRKMQPGQTVAAEYQTPILFQIAQDLSQIQIWAQVDAADIGAVRPGAAMPLRRIGRCTRLRLSAKPSSRGIAVMRRAPRTGQAVNNASPRRINAAALSFARDCAQC